MSAMSFPLLRLLGHCPVFLGMRSVSVLLVQVCELPVHGRLQRLGDLGAFIEEGRQIFKILIGYRSPAEELGEAFALKPLVSLTVMSSGALRTALSMYSNPLLALAARVIPSPPSLASST